MIGKTGQAQTDVVDLVTWEQKNNSDNSRSTMTQGSEQWEEQAKENQDLRGQLAVAVARIEELEKKKGEPPSFVKANVKKTQEKKPRQPRKPEQNGARKLLSLTLLLKTSGARHKDSP